MKLIASNRDYYDHFARDRNVSDQAYVWTRRPKVATIDFAIPGIVRAGNRGMPWLRKRDSNDFDAVGFVVWFCGRAVPVVKVVDETFASGYCMSRAVNFFYSFDSLPAHVKGEEPGKTRNDRKYRNTWLRFEDLFALGGERGWNRQSFHADSYSGTALPKVGIDEMHRRVGSPVFCHPSVIEEHLKEFQDSGVEVKVTGRGQRITERPCVLVNPVLSHVDFNRHIDAFQAFLALERYLANEMAPRDGRMDKPIPDKVKARSKGFNDRSFRKDPSPRKKA